MHKSKKKYVELGGFMSDWKDSPEDVVEQVQDILKKEKIEFVLDPESEHSDSYSWGVLKESPKGKTKAQILKEWKKEWP
jgi:hypothetical protein